MLPSAKKCAVCGSIFDAPRLRTQLAAIETKLADPALWSNAALSQPIMRDRKRIEAHLEPIKLKLGDIVCDAGGLLKNSAAIFGGSLQEDIDFSLLDDAVGVLAGAGAEK